MTIAILGAGNAGCTVAADMSLKGHDVTLIKTSDSMHDDNFEKIKADNGKISIIENGQQKTAVLKNVTRDVSFVSDCDLVIIYTQTNFHEHLIKRVMPYLNDGQTLMLNPGYFSTAYVIKHNVEKRDIAVVEAESSFIDCRITEPGVVTVSFRNVLNPLGIYPHKHKQKTVELLEKLDYPFEYIDSVAEAALHNPNLIVHTIGAVMSIPRIEKTNGDYCMYHEVFQPSVCNILERLDDEKMDVLEKLGCERLSYFEACKKRNTLDNSIDGKEVFFWYANMPNVVKGPSSVNSRYITEDVSQGLVMLESLGKALGIKTPICSSFIEIAGAALNMDFRAKGRSIESLGKENIHTILQDIFNNPAL